MPWLLWVTLQLLCWAASVLVCALGRLVFITKARYPPSLLEVTKVRSWRNKCSPVYKTSKGSGSNFLVISSFLLSSLCSHGNCLLQEWGRSAKEDLEIWSKFHFVSPQGVRQCLTGSKKRRRARSTIETRIMLKEQRYSCFEVREKDMNICMQGSEKRWRPVGVWI